MVAYLTGVAAVLAMALGADYVNVPGLVLLSILGVVGGFRLGLVGRRTAVGFAAGVCLFIATAEGWLLGISPLVSVGVAIVVIVLSVVGGVLGWWGRP